MASCKCNGSGKCKSGGYKCGDKGHEPGHECKCKRIKSTPSVKSNRK